MTQNTNNKEIDTESMILKAAEYEFLNKGFAGARTTAIAEAAGVTHGMFHYYFRTKEKLFEKILSEKIGLMRMLITNSVLDETMPLDQRLRRVISVHLDFLAANPGLPKFLIDEVFSNPSRVSKFSEQFGEILPTVIGIFEKDLRKGIEAGIYREVDITMLIIDIISLNVFSFVAMPMLRVCFGDIDSESDSFLERRKRDIFDTVWRKIAISS